MCQGIVGSGSLRAGPGRRLHGEARAGVREGRRDNSTNDTTATTTTTNNDNNLNIIIIITIIIIILLIIMIMVMIIIIIIVRGHPTNHQSFVTGCMQSKHR